MKTFTVKPLGGAARKPARPRDPTEQVEAAIAALPATWDAAPAPKAPALDLPWWVVLVFQTRAQKFEFLEKASLDLAADVHQNGTGLAERLAGQGPQHRKAAKKFSVKPLTVAAPLSEAEDDEPEAPRERSEFQQRADREQQRFLESVDSTYWIAFCFASAAERDSIAAQLGGIPRDGNRFDGPAVAHLLGITLETLTPEWRTPPQRRRWLPLVRSGS